MPLKPLRPCNKIGCRKLSRERYCEEHQELAKQQDRERYRHYDKHKRDKQAASFYNSKTWELVRGQALSRDKGLCQHCLMNKRINTADMVDHIIPVRVAWHLRLTLNNLQSLCNRCHAAKTAEDKGKYRS